MAAVRTTPRTNGLLAAAFLTLAASPAFAHAVLLKSDPQDGQVLIEAPRTVHLTFNEPVRMTRLQAVSSDGTVIRSTTASPLAGSLTWTFPGALADGGWLLSYSAISTDSHPISGTVRFVIGDGAVIFGEAPPQTDALTQYPRLLLLAGGVAGAGMLLAGALFGGRPGRAARGILG